MAASSARAVYTAIVGNTIVMVAKFIAFAFTGSAAMLSEGIHSLADVSNQVLLALGISRSKRDADAEHPYGYGRAQFVWALISAVGIFFIGCGVTVYHGVTAVLHPHPIESPGIAAGVLLFALIIEGYCLLVALEAVRHNARQAGMTTMDFLRHGPDPMGSAVVLEDSAAVGGVVIAAVTLGLGLWTGNPIWDGVGSIIIGLLLGYVAVFLVNKNRVYLLDATIPEADKERILAVLAQSAVVESVHDVKATMVGAETIRFKAEVEFDGQEVARRFLAHHPIPDLGDPAKNEEMHAFLVQYADHIVEALGDEIDRIEKDIQAVVPNAKHVDIETN
jgi:zinc transporter 9